MTSTTWTFWSTAVIFGIVSVLLYQVLIRPLLSPTTAGAPTQRRVVGSNAPATNLQQQQHQNQNQQRLGQPGSDTNNSNSNNMAFSSMVARQWRVPCHVSATASEAFAGDCSSAVLNDGIVSFRHTKAAAASVFASSTAALLAQQRKDRARILARLLESNSSSSSTGSSLATTTTPPAKGCTIVISIPCEDVECPKLRKILYLLATLYTIFVILVIPPLPPASDNNNNNKEMQNLRLDCIRKLRGQQNNSNGGDEPDHQDSEESTYLSVDVLPDHRILAASTVAGRVAFVRQLQRIEFLIDFDPQVSQELGRFGYKVIVYGQKKLKQTKQQEQGTAADDSCSRLGRELLA